MSAIWSTDTAVLQGTPGYVYVMGPGYAVYPGGMSVGMSLQDPSGVFTLALEDRGPALYQNGNLIWLWGDSTGYPWGTTSMWIGKDGNLRVFGPSDGKGGWVVLRSTTGGSQGSSLQLQSDGNLVLYPSGEHE